MNELVWSDVVSVLQGLQSFFKDRGQYVALLIYLQDEKRGALGDASLASGSEGLGNSVGEDQ